MCFCSVWLACAVQSPHVISFESNCDTLTWVHFDPGWRLSAWLVAENLIKCRGCITLAMYFDSVRIEGDKSGKKKRNKGEREKRETGEMCWRKDKNTSSKAGRHRGDQSHQSVLVEDSSFSLSCYLHTSQSLWIRNRKPTKRPRSVLIWPQFSGSSEANSWERCFKYVVWYSISIYLFK